MRRTTVDIVRPLTPIVWGEMGVLSIEEVFVLNDAPFQIPTFKVSLALISKIGKKWIDRRSARAPTSSTTPSMCLPCCACVYLVVWTVVYKVRFFVFIIPC